MDEDSPKVVLFTDQQWDDIASFCCNDIDGHKAILYVDVSFQLGSLFVLVTSYQNTTLYTKNSSLSVCPVLLGPIMLCMLKDKASYITLFQKNDCPHSRFKGLFASLMHRRRESTSSRVRSRV